MNSFSKVGCIQMQNRRNACHKLQKEKVDQQENYKTCVNPVALLVTLLKYTV